MRRILNRTFILHLLFFLLFLLLFSFVFRELLVNLSENLIDTRDYSLMVWIISQNIEKILSLNFSNYFDTNTFYPHRYVLLFSDLLLPQSLISIPSFLLSKNLILSFNITFIITFLLNYISLYFFWKIIFKNNLIAFLGSIFFIFSPFLHLELFHFQLLNYWPFFLSLNFLIISLKEVLPYKRFIYAALSGLFLAIQFLASVYLAVYLIVAVLVYLTVHLIFTKNFKRVVQLFFFVFAIFILIDGIFIKSYNDMKIYYKIERELGEFITYSANISDYLFTGSIGSLIHQSPILDKWNSFDKNTWGGRASSAGFLFTVLLLFALVGIGLRRSSINFTISLDQGKTFFLVLIFIGVIFSIGPRAKFNGNYAEIPLPYAFVMKTVPLVQSIRASSRWSFLFYLGVIYFTLITLNNLTNKRGGSKILVLLIFILFFIEYIPVNIKTDKVSPVEGNYSLLKDICSKQKQVLLELPVTHLDSGENIVQGLSYINSVQLASSNHKCNLVNGYSGYDLPALFKLKDEINSSITSQNIDKFLQILNDNNIDVVKINKGLLIKEVQAAGPIFYENLKSQRNVEILDLNIYKINKKSVND